MRDADWLVFCIWTDICHGYLGLCHELFHVAGPNGTGAMPELHILRIPLQLGWYSTLNCKAVTPNGITMTKTRIIVYAQTSSAP